MTEVEQRDRVDAVARSWLGTPYHDCAQIKGVGVDCGMLLRAVYVEAGIVPDFAIAAYSPQHFLHSDREHYLGYVLQFAREVARDEAQHGDIVLYRIGHCFAHGAIILSPGLPNVLHAHSLSKMVRRGNVDAVHLGLPIRAVKFFSCWGR